VSDLRSQINNLSAAEKQNCSIRSGKAWKLTDGQRAELDYRIARHEPNPSDVIPWEQVRTGLFKNP
jgi:putative addiction module component (TIGR02574 family)